MRLRRHSARTLLLLRALLYVALLVIAALVIDRVAVVLAPVATGLFLAYLFDPTLQRLERRRVPRAVGIVLLLLLLAGVLTGIIVLLPPLLSRQIDYFLERWHAQQDRMQTVVLPWLRERLHLRKSASWDEAMRQALARAETALAGASGDLSSAVESAFSTAKGLLRVVLAVVLTPVFAVYFLFDYHALRQSVRDLVPPHLRERVLGVVHEINHALSSWLRGQLTVMFILGTLYATGLTLTGVPLGLAIGIFTGLMAFVPYVGVFIGLILALAVSLLDPHPASALFGVFCTFAAVQALDGLFITPRVLGGRVGLSPVAVILALSLGGELLGYAGVLLAVPAAAVIKVLYAHARRHYLASEFYRGAAEAEGDTVAAVTLRAPDSSEPPPAPRVVGGRGE